MDVLGTVAASFLNRPSSVTVCLQRPSPLPTESLRVLNPKPRLGRAIHLKFPRCPHLQAYVPSDGKSKRRACKVTVGHLSTLVSELPNTWQLCTVLSNYSYVVLFCFFQTMPPAHTTPSNPVLICFFSAWLCLFSLS